MTPGRTGGGPRRALQPLPRASAPPPVADLLLSVVAPDPHPPPFHERHHPPPVIRHQHAACQVDRLLCRHLPPRVGFTFPDLCSNFCLPFAPLRFGAPAGGT